MVVRPEQLASPVVAPDVIALVSSASDAYRRPIDSIAIEGSLVAMLGQRNVGPTELRRRPWRRPREPIALIHAPPEKGQLKAIILPIRRAQVAGIVPPLGLKRRMGGMIFRKMEYAPGQRQLKAAARRDSRHPD